MCVVDRDSRDRLAGRRDPGQPPARAGQSTSFLSLLLQTTAILIIQKALEDMEVSQSPKSSTSGLSFHSVPDNYPVPSLSQYQYSSLTSKETTIRLLELLPGKSATQSEHADPIKCNIIEISAENVMPYVALSYAWGSESGSRTITVAENYYINITSNLYDALAQIRHPSASKILWIDAICIDQENTAERNHQVSLMTQIYSYAEQLLIWLGSQDNSIAVSLIARFAAASDGQAGAQNMVTRHAIPLRAWSYLEACLEAAWFRRMWVVQELVLGLQMEGTHPTAVLYGQDSFLWSELINCCIWLDSNLSMLFANPAISRSATGIRRGIERILFLHNMAQQPPDDPQTEQAWTEWLVSTLPAVRDRGSTDPRDKIFALYGLCNTVDRPLPDYTLPTAELYSAFAFSTIITTQSFDLLHEVEPQANPFGKSLPSWTPDWSEPLRRSPMTRKKDLKTIAWEQIITYDIIPYEPQAPGTLQVLYKVIDEVTWVSRPIRSENIQEIAKSTRSWLSDLWSTYSWENDSCKFSDFVRTMILNETFDGLDQLIQEGPQYFWEALCGAARRRKERLDIFKVRLEANMRRRPDKLEDRWTYGLHTSYDKHSTWGLRRYASASLASVIAGIRVNSPPPEPSRIRGSFTDTYLELLNKWSHERVLYTTSEGAIGLGVVGSEVGDLVVALGMPMAVWHSPFTVRRSPEGSARLIGEAYLHAFQASEHNDIRHGWSFLQLN